MSDDKRSTPVVLCIMSGVGVGEAGDHNAMHLADTPVLDELRQTCPTTTLAASGSHVGFPDGSPGNGEVGHQTIAAGRILESERVRIDRSIAEATLSRKPMMDQTMRIALYDGCPLHVFGLLSDAGMHSSMDHLFAIIDLADFHEIPVLVHAISDGRDTPRRSALDYLGRLETHAEGKNVTVATLSGRHYAMDSSQRWDRVYRAFHAIVRDKVLGAEAERAENSWEAVSTAYGRGHDDGFIEPVRLGDYQGIKGEFLCDFSVSTPVWEWTGEEAGLAFNFRGDRMRQLAAMLTREDLPDEVANDLLMDRHNPVRAFREHCFATMTSYSDSLNIPVVFERQPVGGTLGEVVAKANLKQVRCAETERAAHVTRFFPSGAEGPFEGESRVLVGSPRLVERYDEKPEMSTPKVAAKACAAIREGADLVVVHLANADVIAQLGDPDATVAAVASVDRAVGDIAAAVREVGGALLVTSDHGNCEVMTDEAGKVLRGHTTNPVPLIYVNPRHEGATLRSDGGLADVAPTVLELLGLEQPAEMTGASLLIKNG